jgi:hypothetical protein
MMDNALHKRVEILADAPLVPRIAAACVASGITGHTVIPALSGRGRGGSWNAEHVTVAETKVMVVAIASATKAQALIDALSPVLDSHRLMLVISDVAVLRGARFD